MIAYISFLPNSKVEESIYEFFPLQGDPTPEQIEQAQNEKLELEIQHARAALDYYKQQNII